MTRRHWSDILISRNAEVIDSIVCVSRRMVDEYGDLNSASVNYSGILQGECSTVLFHSRWSVTLYKVIAFFVQFLISIYGTWH